MLGESIKPGLEARFSILIDIRSNGVAIGTKLLRIFRLSYGPEKEYKNGYVCGRQFNRVWACYLLPGRQ